MATTYVKKTNRKFVRKNATNIKKKKVGNMIIYERAKGEKRTCLGRMGTKANVNGVDNKAAFNSMQQVAKMLYQKMRPEYIDDNEQLTQEAIRLKLQDINAAKQYLVNCVREAIDPSINWDQPELLWADPSRARYK